MVMYLYKVENRYHLLSFSHLSSCDVGLLLATAMNLLIIGCKLPSADGLAMLQRFHLLDPILEILNRTCLLVVCKLPNANATCMLYASFLGAHSRRGGAARSVCFYIPAIHQVLVWDVTTHGGWHYSKAGWDEARQESTASQSDLK